MTVRPNLAALHAIYCQSGPVPIIEAASNALVEMPSLIHYAEALEAALRAILEAYATVDLEQQHAAMQAARALVEEG